MLTVELKNKIIGAYMACHSIRQVARLLHLSSSTVWRWVNRNFETGTVSRKHGSGRPKKTDVRSDRRLHRLARLNPFCTIRDLHRDWGEGVSIWTMKRRLKEFGLHKYRVLRVPLLTKRHKRDRLDWAMRRCHWRHQWSRVRRVRRVALSAQPH